MNSNVEKQKPIQKKIVYAGNGEVPEFIHGTKINFHFITKLSDGSEKVLDDSRMWEKPMEIIFGKKFKLEVWELCLQTMKIGEVASFTCKRNYTCNYPTVLKTLRDNFGPNGSQAKTSGHMCAMMAMQMEGGLGYDDLNELMKEPQELEFIIELLSVEQPDEYTKESWQMDADEKLASISRLREEGNRLYREKETAAAATTYADAIGRLEQLMLREKPHDEDWLKLRDMKLPLLLNFSQCKLSLKEYYPTIEHCTEVLNADSDNVKALFRRGKAHAGAWNPQEAKTDFARAAEIDATLDSLCRKEIKLIEEMELQKVQDDKERLKNMF